MLSLSDALVNKLLIKLRYCFAALIPLNYNRSVSTPVLAMSSLIIIPAVLQAHHGNIKLLNESSLLTIVDTKSSRSRSRYPIPKLAVLIHLSRTSPLHDSMVKLSRDFGLSYYCTVRVE